MSEQELLRIMTPGNIWGAIVYFVAVLAFVPMIADRKGLNPYLWVFFGFLLGPLLTLIALAAMPPEWQTPEEHKPPRG